MQDSRMCSSKSMMAAWLPQRQQQLGAENTVTTFLPWVKEQPSTTSWWARAIIFSLLVWLNCSAMSDPKVKPAPRGEMPQPQRQSGSDHSRSHMGPSCGTSILRSSWRMWSRESTEGESPPWRQKYWPSTRAVMGRQSKSQVKHFQTEGLPYLRAHSSQKPQTWVIWRDSWLPRRMVRRSRQRTLRAMSRVTVSTEWCPRSTQSPMNRQLVSGSFPPILNSSMRSWNWPWMSPQMMTGARTGWTLASSVRISLAFSQSCLTPTSGSGRHFINSSIWASNSLTSFIYILNLRYLNLAQAKAVKPDLQ